MVGAVQSQEINKNRYTFMEKFEIFKLRLCKGLFDGIISDYILAVVKNTEHILEVPILAEILDDIISKEEKEDIVNLAKDAIKLSDSVLKLNGDHNE